MNAQSIRIDGWHQAALTTVDLERSIDFYRDVLGLSLIADFDRPALYSFESVKSGYPSEKWTK